MQISFGRIGKLRGFYSGNLAGKTNPDSNKYTG